MVKLEKDEVPDVRVHEWLEDIVWECRIESEVPSDLLPDDARYFRFDYISVEYWKPNPINRTVNLDCCPWWVDKDKVYERLPELWGQCDKQTGKMLAIIERLILELEEQGIKAELIEIPDHWRIWLVENPRKNVILGIPCRGSLDYHFVRVFSSDDDGRFAKVNLKS